jgi:hypothetical protein
MKTCPRCGKPLPLQYGRGGRRKYCLDCSPQRNDPRRKTIKAAPLNFDSGEVQTTADSVQGAVLAAVQAAGAAGTWQAACAVNLAARIDNPQEPAAGVVAAVKVLRLILADVLVAADEPEEDMLTVMRRKLAQRSE